MRLRMDLAYDGAGFHGWARQDGLRTVQGDLEGALATVLRVESVARHLRRAHRHRGACAGPGRARRPRGPGPGTRATSADASTACCPPTCAYAAWSRPRPASTRASRRCGAATPTGSPTDRRPVDPLTRGYVLAWRRPLDLDAIDAASKDLLGRHDFAAFCKRREGATTIRTLLDLSWDARRRRRPRRHRARRRVLPPHGPLAGRLPGGRRRGPPARRRGPARCWRRAQRDPAVDRRCRPTA